MKTAALLLLLQLQPLLGTAACLSFSDKAAQSECEMPDHAAVPNTVAPSEEPARDCALVSVCAPAPLAILSLADVPESIVAPYTESPSTAAPMLLGISTAPPFDPPRA